MKTIGNFFKTLILGLLLITAVVCFLVKLDNRERSSSSAASSAAVSQIKPADLQQLIAETYQVEQSRFIQPDLLWVTLPAGVDVQKTCQAIANVWAHRSGLNYVRVESWQDNQRLAQATVRDGQPITP